MSQRTLEIAVLSGEGLRIGRRPLKKKSYAVVRVDAQSFGTTEIDQEGGSYPSWNRKVSLGFPAHASFFTVEVRCRTFLGDRMVGRATVPASDFLCRYTMGRNFIQFLSYRLRDGRGERNGIVNISVRVKVPENLDCPMAVEPEVGVPVGEQSLCGGVAAGIPVWPCIDRRTIQ